MSVSIFNRNCVLPTPGLPMMARCEFACLAVLFSSMISSVRCNSVRQMKMSSPLPSRVCARAPADAGSAFALSVPATVLPANGIQVSYNQHENRSADFYYVLNRARGLYNENGYLHFAISKEATFEGLSFRYQRATK